MIRSPRLLTTGAALAAVVVLGVVGASPALAASATGVSGSASFLNVGTTKQQLSGTVKFTSTYTGSYTVKYDVFRSTSSTKTSPVKVNTKTVFTKSLSTKSATVYTYGPNVSTCLPGTTAYYYWIQGTVSDTGTGIVSFSSPVTALTKACTSL